MATNHSPRFGLFARVLGGLLATASLGGCSLQAYPEIPRFAESGGQTQADLDATLATIPGLTFTDASGSKPNAKGNTGYSFDMTLDPAYEIADAPALVDFLVLSAWSVRDGYMPNTTIEISLDGGPLATDKVNLVKAGEDSGWVPVGSQLDRMTPETGGSAPEFANGYSNVSVWLTIDGVNPSTAEKRGATANRDRLGDWPGAAPELPTDIVVPRATDN